MADAIEIDLSACDREPIHVPGAIQPHGLLLVANDDGLVEQAAGDFARLLAVEGSAIGRNIAELLDSDAVKAPFDVGYRGVIRSAEGRTFDLTAHRSGRSTVFELEPASEARPSPSESLRLVQAAASAIAAAQTPVAACQAAADAVRGITGFDRIMVYRFLTDGSGRVVGEARAADIAPLLHQHFPASDIPRQARALYLRNRIRLIPNVSYTPAPLTGGTGTLDMSDCILRSVSPVHLQYLKNMGVAASASVSIVVDGALWGLIACHASAPRAIPHEARQMCCLVADMLAHDLARRSDAALHAQVLKFVRRREDFLPILIHADSIEGALSDALEEVGGLIPSDGVALWNDGDVTCGGSTPPEDEVDGLVRWLLRPDARAAWSTDSLSQAYPPAQAYTTPASGLASVIVRREPGLVLMWFRAEQVETVNWAGNPHKAAEPGSGGLLTPRKSFELWQEIVRGRSSPWSESEVEATRLFAQAVRDVAHQKSLADMNRELRAAVGARDEMIDKKDLLMREVHHRVQNSLQLVASMLHIQAAEFADEALRHQFELARQRVMAVAMAHRRLWRADEADTINLETFLEEISDNLVETWGPDWEERLNVQVAPVRVPTSEAVILALLATELLTNAVKHAYDGHAGPLELIVRERPDDGMLEVAVCDHGKGFSGTARPGSFGSRLTQGLVRQLKGRIDFVDNAPGTRAVLTLPKRKMTAKG